MEWEEQKQRATPESKHPKRKMKTPSQLETLERVYADDKYPSDDVREALSAQLNLTDRQLRMWFCHRRLKDRKVNEEGAVKRPKVESSPGSNEYHPNNAYRMADADQTSEYYHDDAEPDLRPPHSKKAVKKDTEGTSRKSSQTFFKTETHIEPSVEQRYYESQAELRHQPWIEPWKQPGSAAETSAIALVESQLGEPLREDGPMLGYEFDPLPPGAFGMPIESVEAGNGAARHKSLGRHDGRANKGYSLESFQTSTLLKQKPPGSGAQSGSKVVCEHQFLPEHPTGTQFYERSAYSRLDRLSEIATSSRIKSFSERPYYGNEGHLGLDDGGSDAAYNRNSHQETDKCIHEQEEARLDKKRKLQIDEGRSAANEKRMRKEEEKQEAVRRKREEQQKKELEKFNREQLKKNERLQREQKREYERMEKLLKKEQRRIEILRRKEETKKEKEAAKAKAAYERATAKKLAKVSTGFMDDEHLELMQLGVYVPGLVSTDLEGILPPPDSSQVSLKKFPPSAVKMRKVLTVPPWSTSNENIFNLFMVWRFLTTFADTIGLWPFTLDEFVQALHDYDSRLISEIHIALLKTLVKDVEDAAQAAAGGSQHVISVAAGGHPEIVEAAYAWGFDIQDWGRNLSPLTWPEILRQFALAAGFGPKWKKTKIQADQCSDLAEVNAGDDAVANLRSGAAAVNAVALMRGRNCGRPPRSQHRLAPGTVKYAAFHVLSLEGGKGLTVLQIADRIQKSGLRDLSTTKTPEASISAALSRDTNLFERVAPSTYCVRAQFRKDPTDEEDILLAAKERIDVFQSGLHDNAETFKDVDDTEEPERDEDYDQDVDDVDADADADADSDASERKAKPGGDVEEGAIVSSKSHNFDAVEGEIDESQVGEAWVQGLMEGEYGSLSVEERLAALTALVHIINEGNAVRLSIEERYAAASAFKRQLWEESQLDKRRIKEEHLRGKAEGTPNSLNALGINEEFDNDDFTRKKASLRGGGTHDFPECSSAILGSVDCERSRAQVRTDIRLRAEKLYTIRSLPLGVDRRYNRYWQFTVGSSLQEPAIGRIYFESHSDGRWEVIDTEEGFDALVAALDTRGCREAHLFTSLKEIESAFKESLRSKNAEQFGASVMSSDVSLVSFKEDSPVSGSEDDPWQVGTVLAEKRKSMSEKKKALIRYKEFDAWLWLQCLSSGHMLKALVSDVRKEPDVLFACDSCHNLYWPKEQHCEVCHKTLPLDMKYSRHTCEQLDGNMCGPIDILPGRFQLLKWLMLQVELSVPREALKDIWSEDTRTAWYENIKVVSCPSDLLQAFTELESAVHHDWLSPSYETAEQLGVKEASGGVRKSPVWVPHTTAAVAMRLMSFDAAVAYTPEQKQRMETEHRKAGVSRIDVAEEDSEDELDSGEESDSPPIAVEGSRNWNITDSRSISPEDGSSERYASQANNGTNVHEGSRSMLCMNATDKRVLQEAYEQEGSSDSQEENEGQEDWEVEDAELVNSSDEHHQLEEEDGESPKEVYDEINGEGIEGSAEAQGDDRETDDDNYRIVGNEEVNDEEIGDTDELSNS